MPLSTARPTAPVAHAHSCLSDAVRRADGAPESPLEYLSPKESEDAGTAGEIGLHAADGRALVAATRAFGEIPARSWRELAVTVGAIAAVGAVAGAAAVGAAPLLVGVPAAGIQALLLVRLFVLFHDHLHGALLARSPFARRFFRFVGLFLLNPSSVWRASHDFHHRHTGQTFGAQIGSFPVMTTDQWAQATPARRLAYRAARHPLTMVLAVATVFGWGMCLAPFLRAPRRHADGGGALVLHGALGAGLVAAFGWAAWILPVALPLALACVVGAYLFYAQHNFPGVRLQVRVSADRVRAAIAASSHLRTGPVLAWFTGNIGYHHIHHVNARVPFYRLPEAMAAIPALATPVTTSLRPADIAACLRLALWDTETETLVELAR